MNQRDRAKIDANYVEMASQINMLDLWPKLVENRIFNSDDCNIPTWRNNLNNFETIKDILLTVKTRGPHAFKNLVKSLRQTGHETLANNLNESGTGSNSQSEREMNSRPGDLHSNGNSENNNRGEESDEEESEEEGINNEEKENEIEGYNSYLSGIAPLKINLIKSKKFRDLPVKGKNGIERYIMRSKPRGYVLIVCIIEYPDLVWNKRVGAQHDVDNLKELFEQMGFEVFVTPNNLTGAGIREAVKDFAAKDFKRVDSCFVIFSCHGEEAGKNWDAEIIGVDKGCNTQYQEIYCSDVVEYFSVENCEDLKIKPKIFIFQMCRGKRSQLAVPRHVPDGVVMVEPNFEEEDNANATPAARISAHTTPTDRNYSNTLVAQATVPGHFSYRDRQTGTWFIQRLCKVFMEQAHKEHVEDLFRIVDKDLEKWRVSENEILTIQGQPLSCQTLHVTNIGFSNHCYLNPGYFGETQ